MISRAGAMPRRPRMLKHPFWIKVRPFSITPFFIAPVLPRETTKMILWQARGVSKPLSNPLIGHWMEWWIFYVKHRDLDERADLTAMMLDPDAGIGSITPAASTSVPLYTAQGSVPWVQMCLKRVTEEYFRVPGEAWNDHVDALGLPVAQLKLNNWLDSFQWESEMPEGPNVDVDLNADDTITAREISVAMQQYELLRQMGLTEQTYEEYLATYGVRTAPIETHRPELVRYVSSWQYPVSHVEPTTGTPTSALSISVSERSDKDRFHSEPGFLFGVCCWRPKIYLTGQTGTASGLLDNLLMWLPKTLAGDGSASLRRLVATNPLLPNVDVDATPGPADPAWIDMRDLFVYGEQFLGNGDAPTAFALPDANGRRTYPIQQEIDDMFVGESPYMSIDGLVSPTVLGEQVDLTLPTPRGTRAT